MKKKKKEYPELLISKFNIKNDIRGQQRCHSNPEEPKTSICIKCHQSSDDSPARHQWADEIIHLLANWHIKVKLEESRQRSAGPRPGRGRAELRA